MGLGPRPRLRWNMPFPPVGLAFSPNLTESLSIYWGNFLKGISPWGIFLYCNYIYNSFQVFLTKKKEGVSIFKVCLCILLYKAAFLLESKVTPSAA